MGVVSPLEHPGEPPPTPTHNDIACPCGSHCAFLMPKGQSSNPIFRSTCMFWTLPRRERDCVIVAIETWDCEVLTGSWYVRLNCSAKNVNLGGFRRAAIITGIMTGFNNWASHAESFKEVSMRFLTEYETNYVIDANSYWTVEMWRLCWTIILIKSVIIDLTHYGNHVFSCQTCEFKLTYWLYS